MTIMQILEYVLAFGGIALLIGVGIFLIVLVIAFGNWMNSGSH